MEKTNKNAKKETQKSAYQKPKIENLGSLSTLIRGNSGANRDMPPFRTRVG